MNLMTVYNEILYLNTQSSKISRSPATPERALDVAGVLALSVEVLSHKISYSNFFFLHYYLHRISQVKNCFAVKYLINIQQNKKSLNFYINTSISQNKTTSSKSNGSSILLLQFVLVILNAQLHEILLVYRFPSYPQICDTSKETRSFSRQILNVHELNDLMTNFQNWIGMTCDTWLLQLPSHLQ